MKKDTSLEMEAIRDGDYIDPAKKIVLGLQHMFTMFGATVLVPIITGLNISVALFMAGCGTLLFYVISKRKRTCFSWVIICFYCPHVSSCR